MTRGHYANFPLPAVPTETTAVQLIEPRRFALTLEDGCTYHVDLTGWPGVAFTTQLAPFVRERIQRMGPGLVQNSVRQILQNLRRFWVFLSERGAMPEALMDLSVELINDYEFWLEQHAGGRIYQRHLMAALISVLRVGAEENAALLPPAILPRLRFLGHGPVGGSIPRDAYSERISQALGIAARDQTLDAWNRIARGDDLPPHPAEVVAQPPSSTACCTAPMSSTSKAAAIGCAISRTPSKVEPTPTPPSGPRCGATIRVRFRVNLDETPRWVCDGRRA